MFPTGRARAQDLDYPEPELSVPDSSVKSFVAAAGMTSPAPPTT